MYSKTQSKQKLTEGLHCTSEHVGLMTVSSLVLTMPLFSHPRGLFCICMQQLFPPVSHGGCARADASPVAVFSLLPVILMLHFQVFIISSLQDLE